MGSAESKAFAPAARAAYQPSFFDAHVKKAQRHISEVEMPPRNTLQGHAAVDGDDFLLSHMRQIQRLAKPIWSPYDRAGAVGLPKSTMGQSSIDAESMMLAELRKISGAQQSLARASPASERTHVGPDAWALQHAKRMEDTRKDAPQVSQRNRFRLMSAPDNKVTAKLGNTGHNGIDSWEMGYTVKAKLHSPGALKQEHRGVKGTVDASNYTIRNHIKYQGHLTEAKIKDPMRHKGVTPTIPADYYLLTEQKRERAAIDEANRFQSMPAPYVAPGDLMDVHQKGAQSAASETHRVKQFSGPIITPIGGIRPANELDLDEDDDEDVSKYAA